ncbi:MAG: tetratricopeptide repeat protein, partial [Anaerolineales bacterium]
PTQYVFTPGDATATPLGSDISDPNYQAGVTAYQAGNYTETVRLMNLVISANPKLAPPYRFRGMAYASLKYYPAGLADEEKALTLNPTYADAWADHGYIEESLGNEDQAVSDYEKALTLDPSLSFVYNNLGVYYFGQGDYQQALDEYKLSTAIDPTRAVAWDGMSEASRQLGDLPGCIRQADQAIKLQPDLWLAYGDRGLCYLDDNDYSSALPDLKTFATNNPTNANGWYNYGIALDDSGDSDGAMKAYTQALSLDPSYYEADINRGLIYYDQGKYILALQDFNTALKSGDIPYAYNGRGYAYYGLKEYDKAVADFNTSIQLYPSACSYAGLALVYVEQGRYQDSLNDAATAHSMDPNCQVKPLLEARARDYYGLEDYTNALAYINQAMQMGISPKDYYYRAIIEQATGNDTAAISDLQAFLENAQGESDVADLLADANARLAKLKQ